jgi:hypothetical protein
MDTARIPEWNTWYHLMNCGFPLKLSGETDFPCMSSRRVGQGRVYVHLGEIEKIDFRAWCDGLARGRSYVSDGYAHALRFSVAGQAPGGADVRLERPGEVAVRATVAFAPEIPLAVAHGGIVPASGRRMVGDTINLHAPRSSEVVRGGSHLVEVVANGAVVAEARVPADGKAHDLEFKVTLDRSAWVALREFPQLHTNPVTVLVGDRPIRASRESALWCAETIRLLWRNRRERISGPEREAAKLAYDRAIATYVRIAEEAGGRDG